MLSLMLSRTCLALQVARSVKKLCPRINICFSVIFHVWQNLQPIKQYFAFYTKYLDSKMQYLGKRIIHETPQEILAEWEYNLNFEIIARYNLFSDAQSLFVHLFLLSQIA